MKPLLFFLLSLCSVCAKTQIVTLTFTTQDTVTVQVGKPIDGNYNSMYYTTIKLIPERSEICNFNIKDLSLVYLKYSTGLKYELLVYPNAKLTIDYADRRIMAYGHSAEGSNFLNVKYVMNHMAYTGKLEKLSDKCFSNTNQLSESLNYFKDSIPHIDLKILDELFSTNQVTLQVANAIKKKGEFDEHYAIVSIYKELLANGDIVKQRNDSVLIYAAIDSIYNNYPPDDNSSKLGLYLYWNDYYYNLYSKLSDNEKNKLLQGYGAETFGPYIHYLLAPASQRMAAFFDAYVAQYAYSVNEFNRKKMLDYFAKEYPESESFAILSEMWEKSKRSYSEPIIITETINSLKDITCLKLFEGNYVFLDLWATWCVPCRLQFAHNKELHKLLECYPKLLLLYVSIDKNEKAWKDAIRANLPGLHLRATEKLTMDILDKIYKNERISIPRYVLLDPEGNVVNDNLSRPSQIEYLKNELDSVFAN